MPTGLAPPSGGAPKASVSTPHSRSTSPAHAALRRPSSHGRLAQLMAPGRSRSTSVHQEASPVTAYADDTVTISGRTTPEQRRRSARAAAASLLASDGRYKKYAAQVDKCLQSFESVNEWADFISFLSKLLKTLQTPSPAYTEIPRKVIVAKRLAQCLNPALPAGVHARALDVYAHIFSMIGVEGLKRDLLIWSSGLFPFFQNASMSVRPTLINIYETYYLPLGDDLRSATKALILALLPGVEEETGDFFDRVFSLLNRLSDAVSQQFFLQCVFLVMISSPVSRLAALNYLSKALVEPPKELASGAAVGLTLRGVSAALSDDNMLVRRGALDLLLRILPLNGAIFAEAEQGDKELLVRAVSAVVLQRDVSLSRRVFHWFLSQDESEGKRAGYFKSNGLSILASTLLGDMQQLSRRDNGTDGHSPFRVFLSLLDKWELGEELSWKLAIPSLSIIKAASSENLTEDGSLAAAVYEALEPSILWKNLFEGVKSDMKEGNTTHLELVMWLLEIVPQHDDEVVTVHAPLMLAQILKAIEDEKRIDTMLDEALRTAVALLAVIPDVLFSGSEETSSGDGIESVLKLAYGDTVKVEQASSEIRQHVAPGIVASVFKASETASEAGWQPDALLHVARLNQLLIDREVPPLSKVDSQKWANAVLGRLSKVRSFAVVDVLVDSALKASRSKLFVPPIDLSSGAVMTPVLDALFRYLRPDAAAYHARAVELLWEYNRLAEIHTLESVIARRMSSVARKGEAFEAFGVLWRQSDDSMLPGEIFQVPMFMVLDGLKSEDPHMLRAAETWMRCNLKSYFRMLDPLLRRILVLMSLRSKDPNGDASLLHYFVSSMTSLFRFGGQGLSKACQSAEIRKSTNTQLVTIVEETFPLSVTYLELLVLLLTKLLESTPNEQLGIRVQSASLELLQLLVTRGDLNTTSIAHIKQTLVDRLTEATTHKQLTLQNAMLHLLHSAITFSSERRPRGHRVYSSTLSIPEKPTSEDEGRAHQFEESLLQMILTGVSAPGNRPILQHWVDFVLMSVSFFELKPLYLRALCECFCEQLRMIMLKLRATFAITSIADMPGTITESEPTMLIGVIERLATALGGKGAHRRSEDKDRQHNDSGGLLGYLPTVFSVEAPQDNATKCEASRYLDDVLEAFFVTWSVTGDAHDDSGSTSASRNQIMTRTRARAKKALEKLFKAQPSEVTGSVVQVWASKSRDIDDSAIFDCLDVLTPSAQKAVDLVCEHLAGKGRGSIESSNPALAAFLEAYISRLEGPIAVQVWNPQYSYARDILSQANTPTARMQLFPILRCLTILGQIVSTTSALEDRRLRRDLQDTYVKLLDIVLSNSSKLGDSAIWERGQEHLVLSDETQSESGVHKIYSFIGDSVLHNLRTFLVDNDRVASACASISSAIIMPAFKQQKVDSIMLNLLREMTKIPVAVKSWRLLVGDAYNDNRFFKMRPEESAQWKPLVCALMDSDKERLGDLLGRITASPSANIFTNREAETVSRSLNLRRLSFVLLAAKRNHHLAQLPSIQEKLVEILRTNVVSPRVHSEVYLCLRVIMCRISPQHLANFWPVILAELLRVFEATMDDPPSDESEDLTLVLAACKFLDLLLVIQSEDFQIHQWIFVTDTTDAEYPPEDYSPEALVDRLGDILAEHANSATASKIEEMNPAIELPDSSLRRPHLSGLKSITSLFQLQPFFSRASIDTFEGVYNNAGIDWDAIEDGLTHEIFEGESQE